MSRLYKNINVSVADESRPIPVAQPEGPLVEDAVDEVDGERAAETQTPAAPTVSPEESAQVRAEAIVADAQERAQQITGDAMRRAQQLRADTLEQAQRELENATKLGYEEGLRAGREDYERETMKAANTLLEICKSIAGLQDHIVDEYVEDIHELIIATARRIVRREIDRDDEVFVSMFAEAVEQVKNVEWLTLRVSGYDIDIPTRNRDKLVELVTTASDFKIIEDRKDGDGRYIIETPDNIIDFSIDTQLERIRTIIEQIKFDERAFDERRLSFGKPR